MLLDDGQLTHCSNLRQAQNLAMPEKFELSEQSDLELLTTCVNIRVSHIRLQRGKTP